MEITGANLSDLGVSFNTHFNKGREEIKETWPVIAEEVPSSGSEEKYGWLADMPELRKWVGDRVIKELSGFDYSIPNEDFEATVGVKKNDIVDDKYAIYGKRFQAMGRSGGKWKDRMAWPMLALGFEEKCFDGQNFFDTDHPVGSKENGNLRTVSNMQAGAGDPWFLLDTTQILMPILIQMRQDLEFAAQEDPNTSESVFMRKKYLYGVDGRAGVGFSLWQTAFGSKAELNAENFEAAKKAMQSFKNDEDVPMGVKPNLLVVGASNEGKARKLILQEKTAGGEDNIWHKAVDIHISAWLD